MTTREGNAVCGGIAIGKILLFERPDSEISTALAKDKAAEWLRFTKAKELADSQLAALYEKALADIGAEQAEIFDVHRMMLEDLDYVEAIQALIEEHGYNAPWAVSQIGQQFSGVFADKDDEYMKARADDVLDISDCLIDIMLNRKKNIELTQPVIIVAENLTPSETVQMDKSKILAFVTREGSSNSHTAILARTMNIPSIIHVDIPLQPTLSGKTMIVDGFEGVCYLDPDDETLEEMHAKQQQEIQRGLLLEEMRGLPSVTAAGRKINLYANIGTPEDLPIALQGDAEGIGLFRSEFLYLGRTNLPSEDEQFECYKKVAEGMAGKRVIIRTMDIGADKKADYLKLKAEENPALGFRAIRICLENNSLFKTQLRAIYRASAFGAVSIMLPMIASVWEVQQCKRVAEQVREELLAEDVAVGEVEIGIMIETPAAVMISDELAKEVEFFSVGTNDLTQYTLAIDRQNPRLDKFYDAHHPAVLRMLRMVAENAHANGIWAGICGELGADPTLTETFLDMGYDELSVFPGRILELRKIVRDSSIS